MAKKTDWGLGRLEHTHLDIELRVFHRVVEVYGWDFPYDFGSG